MAPAIVNRGLLDDLRYTSDDLSSSSTTTNSKKALPIPAKSKQQQQQQQQQQQTKSLTDANNDNAFEKLVESIREILGEHRDLKSEDIDAETLKTVLRSYKSVDSEWEKYAFVDLSRHYTRNLVDDINANANLVIMVWTPGKSSLVHDHTNSHCVMRVLKGKLVETKYHWPEPGVEEPLKVKEITHFGEGEVAYINDDLGIHKVENADPENITVSLHLYTPPFIEEKGCNTFNMKTGKSNHISMAAYYSTAGRRQCGRKLSGGDSCE